MPVKCLSCETEHQDESQPKEADGASVGCGASAVCRAGVKELDSARLGGRSVCRAGGDCALFDAYPTENVTAQAMGIQARFGIAAAGDGGLAPQALRRPVRALHPGWRMCCLNCSLARRNRAPTAALRKSGSAIRGDWMPPTKASPAAQALHTAVPMCCR